MIGGLQVRAGPTPKGQHKLDLLEKERKKTKSQSWKGWESGKNGYEGWGRGEYVLDTLYRVPEELIKTLLKFILKAILLVTQDTL